jgi:hypothetical protein
LELKIQKSSTFFTMLTKNLLGIPATSLDKGGLRGKEARRTR